MWNTSFTCLLVWGFFLYLLKQITTFLLSSRNLLAWVNYSTWLKDTFSSGAVEVFNQGDVRAQGGAREHNSQKEQLQATSWSSLAPAGTALLTPGWAFIILLGKSLLEVPSCKAFSSQRIIYSSAAWCHWAAGTGMCSWSSPGTAQHRDHADCHNSWAIATKICPVPGRNVWQHKIESEEDLPFHNPPLLLWVLETLPWQSSWILILILRGYNSVVPFVTTWLQQRSSRGECDGTEQPLE